MSGRITGTATYRERMALPPSAVFEAQLEDVSRADAPSEVIASARIASTGNPPIPFEIPYAPSPIEAIAPMSFAPGFLLAVTSFSPPIRRMPC